MVGLRGMATAVVLAAVMSPGEDVWAQDAAAAAPQPAASDAEADRIIDLARRGMELERVGRYAEALPLLGEAYRTLAAQAAPQNRWRAQTTLSLGNVLDRLKRRQEAVNILAHLNQALIDAGQDAATDAPAVAYALAWVLHNDERFEEAGPPAERACALYARPEHGADPARCRRLDLVRAAAGIAVDLTPEQREEVQAKLDMRAMTRAMAADDRQAADDAMARVLPWFERTEGPEAPLTLDMRDIRARWRLGTARVDEALAETAEIHAIALRVLGPVDPRTLRYLEHYADAALAAGRGGEAFAVLDAADRAVSARAGAGSVEVLRLAVWRANLLQGLGRYDEAAGVLEAGIAAASGLPAADPDRLGARISLAALLPLRGRPTEGVESLIALLAEQATVEDVDQNRLNQARLSLAEGLTIAGRADEASQILDSALIAYPADAPKTMQLRAMALLLQSLAYRQLGRPAAALTLAREADAILETRTPLSILRIRALRNVGSTLIAMERYAEAGEVMRDTVALEARVLGEDHPETVTTLLALAEAQYEAESLEAAGATMTRAVLLAERRFGRDHSFVGTAYNQAATLAWRAGDYEAAGRFIDIAAANLTAALGADNPQALLARTNQAAILAEQGRREEATEAYQAVLDARIRVLGADHPSVGSTLHTMAMQMQPELPPDEAERMLRRAVAIGRARLEPSDPDRMLWESGLAWQLMATDRPAEALDLLRAVGVQAAARPGGLSIEAVGMTESRRLRRMFRGQVLAAWSVARGRTGEGETR